MTNFLTILLYITRKTTILQHPHFYLIGPLIQHLEQNEGRLVCCDSFNGICIDAETFLRRLHWFLYYSVVWMKRQHLQKCGKFICDLICVSFIQPFLTPSSSSISLQYFCNIINEINIKMKPNNMRAPVISDIYSQKMTYENHLKKLERIREERKTNLNLDHNRHIHLQQIKDTKSRSFAHKFNEQNFQINQSNLKFLTKLQNVRSFTRYPSHTSYDRPLRQKETFIKPLTKRKIIETEKENSRIFFKMKSVSSTLSKDRMLNDYAKAEKIKTRITKYALQNNKVALKSEKYFSHNKSVLSNHSLANSHTDRAKNNLATFYKKEDIIRNKISKTDIKRLKSNRVLPSLSKEIQDGSMYQEDKAFFTTEPIKNKRIFTQRRKA